MLTDALGWAQPRARQQPENARLGQAWRHSRLRGSCGAPFKACIGLATTALPDRLHDESEGPQTPARGAGVVWWVRVGLQVSGAEHLGLCRDEQGDQREGGGRPAAALEDERGGRRAYR
jgi:hypothetical protein